MKGSGAQPGLCPKGLREQTRRGGSWAPWTLLIQSGLKKRIVPSTGPQKFAERGAPGHYRLFLTPTSKPHLWLLLRRTTFKLTMYYRFCLCLLIKVKGVYCFWKIITSVYQKATRRLSNFQPAGLQGSCESTTAHAHLPLPRADNVSHTLTSVSQVSGTEKIV